MPPGANLLMRGLGMRTTEKHIKNKKRGRGDLDDYNRPSPMLRDGDGGIYPMPLGAHGNGDFEFPPYMTDEEIALLPARYLDGHQGSLGGLSDDYVWSLFEYERSQSRRQGHPSRYGHVQGRKVRDNLEFEEWLRNHRDREKLENIMARDHGREYVSPINNICNDSQPRSRLTSESGDSRFIYDWEPDSRRRGDRSHKRPQSHRHGFFDIGNPGQRQPHPGYEMHGVPRGGRRPPLGAFPDYRDLHPHRHPATGAVHTPRGSGRRPNHAHGSPGNHARHVPFDRPLGEFRLPKHARSHHPNYPDFDPRSRRRNHHQFPPHGANDQDEHQPDLDLEEHDDASSLGSTHSFIRRPPSPRIVYSHLPPYYGNPLHHDDEDGVDRLFGRRGDRRDGGHVRFGPGPRRRGRGGDVGFSGDEDEDEAHAY